MEEEVIRFKPLKDNEVALFCEQMAMILKSGISSREGLSLMAEDSRGTDGRDLLSFLGGAMDTGSTFSEAMSASHVWPKYVLSMTALGETSGNLDDVMESLSAYYRRETDTSRALKSAVTYPLVMIAMLLAVIIVLVTKVLPIFNDVFKQLGTEMTGISRGLLNFGYALSRDSVTIITVLAVIVVLLAVLNGTAAGKHALKRFADRFFLTRKLHADRALGRFASSLAMTIKSGLDTELALSMISGLVDHQALENKIDDCRQKMKNGENFGNALVSSGIFRGLYGRMVTIGFRTGSLDKAMERISENIDSDIEESTARTLSTLEPTLVAVLSIIVGMILLSVMLPLMGIMLNIG